MGQILIIQGMVILVLVELVQVDQLLEEPKANQEHKGLQD